LIPSSALIDEYVLWLTVEKGRSRATVDAYRRDLGTFAGWLATSGLDASSVHEHDLERYVASLREAGRAPSTVARTVATLRGWFGYLVEERHLSSDPTGRLRPGRRPRSLPRPLAESEMIGLIESVVGETPMDRRDRALLELLYGTGARVSEATGIELGDLDFDEELVLVTGKGNKQRLVPMGRALREALRDYLAPGGRSSFRDAATHGRLFVNARGGALSRQGVDLIVDRRALAFGIERSRISAHVFRHSCATHMLAHGADIRVVQELLGHASIGTTQVYTAVSVTSLQREYQDAHPRAHE
jgi:integrase/recombinase XerD